MTKRSDSPAAPVTKHTPRRTCVVCRDERPKRELLRVVRGADGLVELDESGKKPGRGAYLCRSVDCWKKGLSKGRLERALRINMDPECRERLVRLGDEICGEVGSASCEREKRND